MVNQLKIITQQPKPIQNLNVTDIKSITTEHPKTSRKLSKTIKQAKKGFQLNKVY